MTNVQITKDISDSNDTGGNTKDNDEPENSPDES